MTKENELTPFTFQDTGKSVLIRKVSPMLAVQLRKDFPPPQPPMVQVSLGEGEPVLEANPADPEYQRKLNEYEQDFAEKSQRLMIKRGTVVNFTDEIRAEVEQLRQFYREEYERELPKDDHLVYVMMLCVGTTDELNELAQAIMQRSQPTEDAIKLAQAAFPG